MKVAGFGCMGCGAFLALGGLVALGLVAAGAVNSAEEGTGLAIGGGLCLGALGPLLIGVALVVVGRRQA